MSVHVECPGCRQRNSLKNKRCRCGRDLDKAKRSGKVRYWIAYRIPAEGRDGQVANRARWESVGFSLNEARDADGKRRAQKRENRIFDILPTGDTTFGELARWYLELDTVKALKYYADIKPYLSRFLDEFGTRRVNTILIVELQNFQAKRKAAGDSDSWIDHQVGAAKTIINKAHENGLVGFREYIAFRKVRKMLRRGANTRKNILSPAQFIALMRHLPAHTKRILVAGYYTGMRRGEILNLTWPKISPDLSFIELEASDTKDAEPRAIPIAAPLAAVLEAAPRSPDVDHVFLYRGKPVTDIRAGLKKACLLAGIPYGQRIRGGFVFHDLRHTFNTYARKAGVAESVIMDITGHATREMFDRYNTIDMEDLKAGQDRFERYMKTEMEKALEKDKVDHFVAH